MAAEPTDSSLEKTRVQLHVFVVENHLDTLKYLKMYLEGLGHDVSIARSYAEALESIPKIRCDVLVSDIGLPDGDGWSLLRSLAQNSDNYPLYAIAMSGFGMNADRKRSSEAGYRDHLLKPFDPEELDKHLERAAKEVNGLN